MLMMALGPRGMELETTAQTGKDNQGLPSHGTDGAIHEEGTCSEAGQKAERESGYYFQLLKSSHFL